MKDRMIRWEMFHQFILIRFPRITKKQKTLIWSGPEKGGAYTIIVVLLIMLLIIWAELAVGIFGSLFGGQQTEK